MAYDKIPEYETGAPKKADVLIRCTQNIALKQEELCEQTKLALARIDEAIEIFSKNNHDSTYVVKQSGEIFDQLQSENSALKQELLYLAKQSENIYAGLAEKITEISDQSKGRDDAFNGIADKINDVAEQAVKGGTAYSEIADKLAELSEQNKRNENLISSLSEKLEAIYERTKLNEKAYGALSDKISVSERSSEPAEVDLSQVMSKLNFITEQLRRNEGAHSMLADKFEILSMRVEQFGFESAKNPVPYPHTTVQPVAYPTPVQTVVPAPVQTIVKEEIDYDKLAEKVAALISTREVVSPDYIASKVAEQIILPGVEAAKVNVSVDGDKIARQVADMVTVDGNKIAKQVADYINANGISAARGETAVTSVAIDEEGLADRIAEKLGGLRVEETAKAPVAATVDIDEESLAERIAKKVGGMRGDAVALSSSHAVQTDIDEEELADRISLKVGSLKSEDFEILVDDNGCSSISKEIADHLDYNAISTIIADKLREVLDLAAVNAPDYEEMAERISEKITVAGINEDAIADKAAAVLSNYLPEFDTDEITDKITGAVIDVVSAMPQPTVDSESICNAISERLIESQENHDYDIVIDDDGISRITELISEEIEKGVSTHLEKVEEDIAKLTEMVGSAATEDSFDNIEEEIAKLSELIAAKAEAEQETAGEEQAEEETEETEEVASETVKTVAVAELAEDDYSKLSELLAAEIEKGTAARFDKVEEGIAKLTEMVNTVATDDGAEYEEEYADYAVEDYSALSEVVAAEIEKGVASRLDGMEENIAKITELITAEEEEIDEEEYSEAEEYEAEDAEEEDYTRLSEAVAAEVEKTLSARLDGMEENIAKITEIITAEEEEIEEEYSEVEEDTEEVSEEEYETEDAEEEDYTRLSEAVAAEVEKTLTARFESVEESIARISEMITAEDETEDAEEQPEETAESEEVSVKSEDVQTAEYVAEPDYTAISEIVAAEIERGVAARLDSVDEKVSAISTLVESANETSARFGKVEEELAKISEIVSDNYGVSERFDRIEEGIAKISETAHTQYTETETDGETAKVAVIAATNSAEVNERFDKLEESISKISELLTIEEEEYDESEAAEIIDDYSAISEVVAAEIEKGVAARFDSFDEKIATITELVENANQSNAKLVELVTEGTENNTQSNEVADTEDLIARLEESIAKISENVQSNNLAEANERFDRLEDSIAKINDAVRMDRLEDNIARISDGAQYNSLAETNDRFDRLEKSIEKLAETLENNAQAKSNAEEKINDSRISNLAEELAEIKAMLAGGIVVSSAADEAAAAQTAEAVEEDEEEKLVTVSDLVPETEEIEEPEPEVEEVKKPLVQTDDEFEEEEESDDDGEDDFLLNVLDVDAFGDDELMPGELSDYAGGVDFANMMKFKRSFIARIIQSNDDYKQYYGEVKHALLSYRKVNSNVAWGAERFNKGRETIARLKIRGKTLCLYLALDPNEYKISVYHHIDVSDNKSVAGTPMMVKVKSPLGVRKAIRLIDEMLAKRNGEKREIPERDYAAMYPYETIEELIEDGLVKDVRKK